MIAQAYKYSAAKQEFKPVSKNIIIHSIRFGEHNPKLLFINRIGDKNTSPVAVTRKAVADGARHEFTYKGTRYAFTLPDEIKRGQLISIEATR